MHDNALYRTNKKELALSRDSFLLCLPVLENAIFVCFRRARYHAI